MLLNTKYGLLNMEKYVFLTNVGQKVLHGNKQRKTSESRVLITKETPVGSMT